MANQATTTYKVTGTRKAVNDLWSTLQKMEVNSKNIWLYQLAEHYGIDYETKQISVRGHIYWAEYEEDPANDYYLLSVRSWGSIMVNNSSLLIGYYDGREKGWRMVER